MRLHDEGRGIHEAFSNEHESQVCVLLRDNEHMTLVKTDSLDYRSNPFQRLLVTLLPKNIRLCGSLKKDCE